MLGAADADLLFDCVDSVAAGDARAALLAAARLADSGRDVAASSAISRRTCAG